MKLIIDIDENVRIAISQMGLLRIPDEMQKKVDKAIQRGTSLDKLKDRIGLEMLEYSSSAGYYRVITKVLQIIDNKNEVNE